jgi:type 1 glutamine amidotransferase
MFRRFLMYGAVLALLVTSMNAQRNRAATESVRQPDSRHLRNAAAKLMGWKVTARGDAFGQLSFSEAIAKADAAGLAFVEGSSIQKVSPRISKNLDDNLSAEEAAVVTGRLQALNLHMAAYRVDSIPSSENAARKLFDFAKSLGAETIVVASNPASLSAIDKLAGESGINVAIAGGKDLKVALNAVKDASPRVGVSADAGSLTQKNALEALPGLKDRLMVLNVDDRSNAARLTGLLLDISRAEPAPQESPDKCSNCSRPYSGTRPLVIALGAAAVADTAGFEKTLRPAMGYRVEQIAKVLPITSTDRVPAADREKIEAALPREAIVKPKKPRKLLVIDLCPAGGYYHATVAHANLALELMAKNSGAYEAVFSNDLNNLKYPKIREFDAVFLNSVVGEVFPDPDVLNGLLRFVREGGGVAGLHGATYASMDLPEYGEMMGAQDGPHHVETATLKIDDPGSPLTKAFDGKEFAWTDEFYHFLPTGPFSRDKVHVLLSIDTGKSDMSPWQGIRPDNDYGISWIKSYGKGRVFNCALGHTPMLFETPAFGKYILSAIQFVLGDLPADTTPSAKLTASR